jgi:hypothetical protein
MATTSTAVRKTTPKAATPAPKKAPKHAFARTLKSFTTASGKTGQFYSLPALARTHAGVNRLPVSLRIVLESVLRRDPLDLEALRVTAQLLAQLGWHQRQQQLIQRSRRAFLDELGELPPDWSQWFTSGSPSV